MKRRINIHPGEVLEQEFMTPVGMTVESLACSLGVSIDKVTGLLAGNEPITAAATRATSRQVAGKIAKPPTRAKPPPALQSPREYQPILLWEAAMSQGSWWSVNFDVGKNYGPLQDEFADVFVRLGGPRGAALFVQDHRGGKATLLFSPKAGEIAEALIVARGGNKCAEPTSASGFLVGHNDDMKMLKITAPWDRKGK